MICVIRDAGRAWDKGSSEEKIRMTWSMSEQVIRAWWNCSCRLSMICVVNHKGRAWDMRIFE